MTPETRSRAEHPAGRDDLAVTIRRCIDSVHGLSEFEKRLLASLIANRLKREGWRKC